MDLQSPLSEGVPFTTLGVYVKTEDSDTDDLPRRGHSDRAPPNTLGTDVTLAIASNTYDC